jgi:hypothetical protein
VIDAVQDLRVKREWSDESDVGTGFEEEEETAGGDETAAD